jgi:RNA polymerase sigma-70 factor (ECF subfamily)
MSAAALQRKHPRLAAAGDNRAIRIDDPARMPVTKSHAATNWQESFARVDADDDLRAVWRRAQAGDELAYRSALRTVATRLRGYFRRRLYANPDDVEDLVQETLLALHLRRGTYDAALPLSAWVHAIARHKMVDHWRRRGHQATSLPLDETDEAFSVAGGEGEARRDIGKLLDKLPDAQQRAIRLTKLEGLSVAEAALQTGISQSAIKVQVHRGLKRLSELVRSER